jgi:hypothetical protein
LELRRNEKVWCTEKKRGREIERNRDKNVLEEEKDVL